MHVADWRKASCSMSNGNCVEVGSASNRVAVRDSAKSDEPVIRYSKRAWNAFLVQLKSEKFNI